MAYTKLSPLRKLNCIKKAKKKGADRAKICKFYKISLSMLNKWLSCDKKKEFCTPGDRAKLAGAVKEAIRKLVAKPKQRSTRGTRISQRWIVGPTEIRAYMVAHAEGLNISSVKLPKRDTFSAMVNAVPKEDRTRTQVSKPKVKNKEITAQQERGRAIMSQGH